MPAHLEARDTGEFAVRGELNFETVVPLWQQAAQRFQDQPFLRIDLGQVSRSDSSGVALLIEWLRQARERQQDVQFVNVPPQMLSIIQVADLDKLLPLG